MVPGAAASAVVVANIATIALADTAAIAAKRILLPIISLSNGCGNTRPVNP